MRAPGCSVCLGLGLFQVMLLRINPSQPLAMQVKCGCLLQLRNHETVALRGEMSRFHLDIFTISCLPTRRSTGFLGQRTGWPSVD